MEIKQSTDTTVAGMLKKSLFPHQAAWIKPVIIFIMMLLLLIPLAFIRSLVNDRERYQRTAEASIMEPVGGEPVIEGLVLAVNQFEPEYFAAGNFQHRGSIFRFARVPQ